MRGKRFHGWDLLSPILTIGWLFENWQWLDFNFAWKWFHQSFPWQNDIWRRLPNSSIRFIVCQLIWASLQRKSWKLDNTHSRRYWVTKECNPSRKPDLRISWDRRSLGLVLLQVPNLAANLFPRSWNQSTPSTSFISFVAIIIYQQKNLTTVLSQHKPPNRAVSSKFKFFYVIVIVT